MFQKKAVDLVINKFYGNIIIATRTHRLDNTIKDKKTLLELSEIKRRATSNFDEEFKIGIPFEEARAELLRRVRAYPW